LSQQSSSHHLQPSSVFCLQLRLSIHHNTSDANTLSIIALIPLLPLLPLLLLLRHFNTTSTSSSPLQWAETATTKPTISTTTLLQSNTTQPQHQHFNGQRRLQLNRPSSLLHSNTCSNRSITSPRHTQTHTAKTPLTMNNEADTNAPAQGRGGYN
jgi:hypothetical protein